MAQIESSPTSVKIDCGARVREDYLPSFDLKISGPQRVKEGVYSLEYHAKNTRQSNLQPVRVELYINNQLIEFRNQDLLTPGTELEQGEF